MNQRTTQVISHGDTLHDKFLYLGKSRPFIAKPGLRSFYEKSILLIRNVRSNNDGGD
jgi:hypothetical protein